MKAFEDLKESTKKDIIIDGLMRSKGVYLSYILLQNYQIVNWKTGVTYLE